MNFLKVKIFINITNLKKLPKLVKHDGYCDVFLRKNLKLNVKQKDSLLKIYGKKMFYVINNDKFQINIDEPEDFKLAEKLIKE